MAARCFPVLSFDVRGGLHNQKECVVNAGIAAHQLGVALALPHLKLIGSGNEPFEPQGAKYVAPYTDRSKWGHFNHLFNASHAVKALAGQIHVLPRLKGSSDGEGLEFETLPSLETVVPHCAGAPRIRGTCEAFPANKKLLERLMAAWQKDITKRCGDYRLGKALGNPLPRVIFEAGKSLCWNAYKSRYGDVCKFQYPICGAMLNALTWNRVSL